MRSLGTRAKRCSISRGTIASFEEAATVFADPEALDWDDPEHSYAEQRSKRLGISL